MWGKEGREEEGREKGGGGGRGREVVMNLTVVTDAVLVEVMIGKRERPDDELESERSLMSVDGCWLFSD